MQPYRFKTRVSENGIIQIPDEFSIKNKEVEVIILPKQEVEESGLTALKFVEKWAGFLSDSDTEKSKFDYLIKKHE